MPKETPIVRSTTVLLVRKENHVALAGDGQVTLGETIMKASARKVRRLYNDQILAGFAGATADAFALLTRFESKLEQYHGNLHEPQMDLLRNGGLTSISGILKLLRLVPVRKDLFLCL